jgi:AcrR family transcriptional regulator
MSRTSRTSAETRTLILKTALARIAHGNGTDVTMANIADAAGISRQAVYLYFSDRAELLVSLARLVDEKVGLMTKLGAIVEAPTGIASILGMVALQAEDNPHRWPLAREFEALRRRDPAVERSWQDRLKHRLDTCRSIVARLQNECSLRQDLNPVVAADILWTLTSPRMWHDLVMERGWTAKQYKTYIGSLAVNALTSFGEGAAACVDIASGVPSKF